MKFSLIVTDSGPLITLAVVNALDDLNPDFVPGLVVGVFIGKRMRPKHISLVRKNRPQ